MLATDASSLASSKLSLDCLHGDHSRFIAHVEKHFSCDAALAALRSTHPFLEAHEEFASSRALIRAVRCDELDAPAQAAITGYTSVARATLTEAAALGWSVEPSKGVTVAFATSGLLVVVVHGVLRTMFFPGFSDSRTRAVRSSGHEANASRRGQAATLDRDEKFFEEVFRPAVQVIRSMPDDRVCGAVSQYGALNRVLPRARELRFDRWLCLRAVVGQSESEARHAC
jgi:hypothetical protein